MNKKLFYCTKCKDKVSAEVKETVTTKNNRKMAKSKCPKCNTSICVFVKE